MSPQNRSLNAAHEREASLEAWREAAALHRLGHHAGSVSRAYYAVLHAGRALLFERGIDPKTHDGLRRMVGLHLVVPGHMPAATADILRDLFYEREAVDYAGEINVAADKAASILAQARVFLAAARVEVED